VTPSTWLLMLMLAARQLAHCCPHILGARLTIDLLKTSSTSVRLSRSSRSFHVVSRLFNIFKIVGTQFTGHRQVLGSSSEYDIIGLNCASVVFIDNVYKPMNSASEKH